MPAFTDDLHAARELKAGNMDALGYFYQLYHQQLYHFLLAYCRDEDLAAEMVQTAFMKVWDKKGQLDVAVSPKNWIYTMAKNLVTDALRKAKFRDRFHDNQLPVAEADYGTLNQLVYADYQRMVRNELERLPLRNREVFDLSRTHQLSNREIAETLNISVKAVEKHLTKTLGILRAVFKAKELLFLFLFLKF